MAYCSISDITATVDSDTLAQLTNDSGTLSVDNSKITDAIAYVGSVIDGYIRGRYSLPLDTIPDTLKYLAVDLVVYRLYSRRMMTNFPEAVLNKWHNSMAMLKDIQNGKFNLGIENTEAFDEPALKTNKSSISSSMNKYYDSNKWDQYNSWL